MASSCSSVACAVCDVADRVGPEPGHLLGARLPYRVPQGEQRLDEGAHALLALTRLPVVHRAGDQHAVRLVSDAVIAGSAPPGRT